MSTRLKIYSIADKYGMVRFATLPSDYLYALSASSAPELSSQIREALCIDLIREAIFIASPELSDRLHQQLHQNNEMGDAKYAAAKYLQRMSFRATPFGIFAAVGGCELNSEVNSLKINTRNIKRHTRFDSTVAMKLRSKILAIQDNRDRLPLKPNGTICRLGNVLHYLKLIEDQSQNITFTLAEVTTSNILDEALGAASPGMPLNDLSTHLACKFSDEYTGDEIKYFVASLVDEQLLCHDELIKPTSGDIFRALSNCLDEIGSPQRKELQQLQSSLDNLSTTTPSSIESYKKIHEMLASLPSIGIDHPLKHTFQIDSYADNTRTLLDKKLCQKLEDASGFIATIISRAGDTLNIFREQFDERYGDNLIPLLEVTDESCGLAAYQGNTRPDFVQDIRTHSTGKSKTKASPLMDVINEYEIPPSDLYIHLTEEQISSCVKNANKTTPDQMAVAWCSLWSTSKANEPVLEVKELVDGHPGRLFGRFSQNLPEISSTLADITEESEQEGEITAEIVHIPHGRSGNIVSRQHNSRYEITIRAGGSPNCETIPLDDIYVFLSKNKVGLWSRRLKRRIRVLMSNAHAYRAGPTIGLYRLLNDIANQSNKGHKLLIDATDSRRHLPGIIYRGIIISRPSWQIFSSDIKNLATIPNGQRHALIQRWRKTFKLPRWVCIHNNDGGIPYDLDCDWMTEQFASQLMKLDSSTLIDAFPLDMRPALLSGDGKPHHHELLIPLRPYGKEIPAAIETVDLPPATHSRISPWGSWIQLNLYCHPDQQDLALINIYARLRHLHRNLAFKSFFVRYADRKGSHIRLRINCGGQSPAYETVVPALAQYLDHALSTGSFSDLTIVPYARETIRYGGDGLLDICERIFSYDSDACIEIIQEWRREHATSWHTALYGLDTLLSTVHSTNLKDKLSFARDAATDYAKEFNFDHADKSSIGKIFKASADDLFPSRQRETSDKTIDIFKRYNARIAPLWGRWRHESTFSLSPEKVREVQWSLIHMRLNRLFTKEQRLQEAMLWDLARRAYERALALRIPSLFFGKY